jgi:tripartite-type tricarboxylate transporter receptor subunit TctC
MFTLPLTHVNVPILQTKLPYDPAKDFTPLSMLATGGPDDGGARQCAVQQPQGIC